MASNTFTIEICNEDRNRLDAFAKALTALDEVNRIVDEVKYVRSQAFWPHMCEFSHGHQTACDEILARINHNKAIHPTPTVKNSLTVDTADVQTAKEDE